MLGQLRRSFTDTGHDMLTKKLIPILLPVTLAAVMSLALRPATAASHGGQPAGCLDKQTEDKLKAREAALLGRAHAQQHAETRAWRCRVALGLEKREDTPSPEVLAKAAAIAPQLAGRWRAPFTIPAAGITAVLLNTGKVLFWSYDPAHYEDPDNSNIGVSYLWDPASGAGAFVPTPENIWCAGQTILADGRVFLAGGNLRFPDPTAPDGERGYQGDASTYIFNPASSRFIKQLEMSHGRWYPTVTQLPDNSAIITSGYDESGSDQVNPVVERFVASADVDGVGTLATVATKKTAGLYPFQYVLPSGAMLQAGPERQNAWLLEPGNWAWSRLPRMLYDHEADGNGIIYTDASVQPMSQIIMIGGGKYLPSNNEWLDGFHPAGGWHDYPKWNLQRHNANTIILPDGKLLTVGGNSTSSNYGGTVFSAELTSGAADDTGGAWIEVAPHSIPAAYHSSAILLPDATVLLSEDDRTKTAGAAANHRLQVYSPPYLFRGARPTLQAPAELTRGEAFDISVSTAAGIASVVLIAPAAVTHGNDMHQRFIKLPIASHAGTLTASVPASSALVPPGYYMLFVVDHAGVPSIAQFVHVA
jgi:hypothetical protein